MLSLWSPFGSEHLTARRNLNKQLFNAFFSDTFGNSNLGIEYRKNEDGSLSVSVDLPGIEEKDIAVEFDEHHVLTITGERKTATSSYSVNKAFHVPEEYDTENIKAELKNGVLTIKLATKPQKSKEAVKIPVTSVK
jgi:HSP20 family protein